ncbi:methyl-accepting chemotaxis protein [Cellvibrio sp. NN19]|uniref:methyl-accepting chemotaxis protein n=1 Tax=Cellvibrio chitinivorans TaxID=3102792 RepID=UPI002B4165B7|nr:methyl-accepting chemotaxis protein [Cellvibrio sp. NN19]
MFGWYQGLTLRMKLMLPLLLLVALVLYMGLHAISTSKLLGSNATTIAKVNLPEIQLLIQADRDLYQAMLAERALLQLDSSAHQKLFSEQSENAKQAQERVYKSLDISNTSTPAERAEFTRRYDAWKVQAAQVIDAVRSSSDDTSRSIAQEQSYGSASDAFEHLREYIDELQESRLVDVDKFTDVIDENQANSSRQLFALAVIGTLVSLLAAYFLPILVANQVRQISHRIQNIAEGDGDLTVRLPVTTNDELGELATNVNQFIEKLQRIIGSVLVNAAEVSKAAESLLEVSSNSQRAADDQCHAITMVVTAVNELTMAIQEVARNTSNTAQNTKEATVITDRGQERIHLAVERVQSLAVRISETAEFMSRLESEAKNVTSVIDVIRGVAEQTNLLALNAAIEAARAGEQGRGFAVVADEVRTLASRTQQSTADIHGMLSKLQQGVQHAVDAMGSSATMTSEAVGSATEAGQSLTGIGSAVKQISDMTLQIATAAEEQSSVTSEIDRNLVQINSLAMNAAEGASQTAAESQRLNELSIQLRQLLMQFKV